ncbi:pseudouridine synthase [Desulfurivibrio alkaliphilus]|uniref:Pseudouridine synthase n=1 Tax=Desulfurivibrio alkaliphilus (strain DSM 19089 / UNIQEM U267 / AHT2) TaxID=589865 RepID=D6Z0U9_DESAT|nr:pseudouridine synthase [Desulfurivibrio alkaliphilus]ADH87209.1 pseudouridine synthase [Desulfurivibrio alkaliphilus AHT 2]
MAERLQKFLARAGIASRRKAEEYIAQGRVQVDGRPVAQMGLTIDPERQQVTFDGQPVLPPSRKLTVLLNKPAGYVTTMADPQGRPIVTSLINEPGLRLFPVGRLDLDTEGALLLTNDGELAQNILHPSRQINRTYHATVKGRPNREALQQLRRGIMLEGRRTWPARIRELRRNQESTTLEVIIHEGRKRQVRKMFAAINHPVLQLKRVAYGGLRLGSLPTGRYRRLSPEDLQLLFRPGNK